MNLAATLRGTTYRFRDLKQVLAKANEEKSGDRLAGVCADSVSERIAAKRVLAEVTLQELYENPVVPPEQDAVTRLILEDVQRPIYDSVKSWTVARLREHVLADTTDGGELLRLSRGLTSEMIAACAKLMSRLSVYSSGLNCTGIVAPVTVLRRTAFSRLINRPQIRPRRSRYDSTRRSSCWMT